MGKVFEGQLTATGLRFAIVVSRFNSFITERLLGGAMDALRRSGAADDMIERPRVRFFVEACDYPEFSRWTEELRTARAGRVMPVRRIA